MRVRVSLIVIIAIGVLLRVRGMVTEFWLDEIWSLRLSQLAHSWSDVFTRLPHDNNHPLNTLWMFLLGDQPNWVWYRIPSFLCGLALIALLIRAVRGDGQRIAVALFASFSLPMIVYGTEARGYAPAAMLCVAAYVWRERPWVSAMAISLAMLAHLTAVFVFAGLIVDALRRPRLTLLAYAIPGAVAAWLYFFFYRRLFIGGGPTTSKIDVSIDAAASILGGSGLLAALLAVAILVFEIIKSDDALFFAVALFAAPAAAMLKHHGPYVNARYFFVCIPFALLLLASFVTRIPKAGIAIMVIWIAATAMQVAPFMRNGRGTYIEAMRYMRRGVVSGDNDFRNGMIIDYYHRYAPELRYGPDGDWFLIESFGDFAAMPRSITAFGRGYTIVKIFPYGGVSGWTWLVYHSAGRRLPPLSNPASIQR